MTSKSLHVGLGRVLAAAESRCFSEAGDASPMATMEMIAGVLGGGHTSLAKQCYHLLRTMLSLLAALDGMPIGQARFCAPGSGLGFPPVLEWVPFPWLCKNKILRMSPHTCMLVSKSCCPCGVACRCNSASRRKAAEVSRLAFVA